MHRDDQQSSLYSNSSSQVSSYSAEEKLADQLEKHPADVERKLASLSDRSSSIYQPPSASSIGNVSHLGTRGSYDHHQQAIEVSAKTRKKSKAEKLSADVERKLASLSDRSSSIYQPPSASSIGNVSYSSTSRGHDHHQQTLEVSAKPRKKSKTDKFSADVERKLESLSDRSSSIYQPPSALSSGSVSYSGTRGSHKHHQEAIDASAKPRKKIKPNEFDMTLDEYKQINSDTSLSTLALERMKDEIGFGFGKGLSGENGGFSGVDGQSDEVFPSVSNHFIKKQPEKPVKRNCKKVKSKKEAQGKGKKVTRVGNKKKNCKVPKKVLKKNTRSKIPPATKKACPLKSSSVCTSTSGSGTTLTMSEKSSETSSNGLPPSRNFVRFDESNQRPKKQARKGYFDSIASTMGKCAKLAYQNMPEIEYNLGPARNRANCCKKKEAPAQRLKSASTSSGLGQTIARSMMMDERFARPDSDQSSSEEDSTDEEDEDYVVETSGNCPQHGSRGKCGIHYDDEKVDDDSLEKHMMNYGQQRQHQPSKYHKKLRKSMKRRTNATRKIARKIKRKDPKFYCLW